jgi:hypothetical protein
MDQGPVASIHPSARKSESGAPAFCHSNGVTEECGRLLDLGRAQSEVVKLQDAHGPPRYWSIDKNKANSLDAKDQQEIEIE